MQGFADFADGILGAPGLGGHVSSCRGDDAVQIDVSGDQCGHRADGGTGTATVFDGGDQAEMP